MMLSPDVWRNDGDRRLGGIEVRQDVETASE
jgi:hypothetical protein